MPGDPRGTLAWREVLTSRPCSSSSRAAVAVAIVALFVVGIGMALVDVPSQPLLADVVDFRCLAGYGVAFSIADVAGCVGFIVGPLLGGRYGRWPAHRLSAAPLYRGTGQDYVVVVA